MSDVNHIALYYDETHMTLDIIRLAGIANDRLLYNDCLLYIDNDGTLVWMKGDTTGMSPNTALAFRRNWSYGKDCEEN